MVKTLKQKGRSFISHLLLFLFNVINEKSSGEVMEKLHSGLQEAMHLHSCVQMGHMVRGIFAQYLMALQVQLTIIIWEVCYRGGSGGANC